MTKEFEMAKEQKVLKVKVKGAALLDIDEMEPIQGSLKKTDPEAKDRLWSRMEKKGIKEPFGIWQHKKKNFILSGTGRWELLKEKRAGGYVIPKMPIFITEADTLKEAKEDILGYSVQIRKITQQGMLDFLSDNIFTPEDLAAFQDMPSFDTLKFIEDFMVDSDSGDVATMTGGDGGPAPGAGGGASLVRLVQLYFDETQQKEFLAKELMLRETYKTENVTATILAVIREAYSAINKNLP